MRTLSVLLWSSVIAIGAAAELPSSEGQTLTGFTAPSRHTNLGAARQARVTEMNVAEGGFVEAGGVVASLARDTQKARVEYARIKAESSVGSRTAKVKLEEAERELERLRTLRESRLTSIDELLDADRAVSIAKLELEKALISGAMNRAQYQIELRILNDHVIRAPFDGLVASHIQKVGEVVDEGEGVVSLVQLNPLAVWIDWPINRACTVEGAEFVVQCARKPESQRVGRVAFISKIADPASQTCRVKLLVDNEDLSWFSGERVNVICNQAAAAALRDKDQPAPQSASTADWRD